MRVRAYDPQSFIGWFADLPWLAAPHRPFRLSVAARRAPSGRVVLEPGRLPLGADDRHARRTALRARDGAEPAGQRVHADAQTVRCDGIYWFRLFPKPYWDTTGSLANGKYRLQILAWDIAGNESEAYSDVTIRN